MGLQNLLGTMMDSGMGGRRHGGGHGSEHGGGHGGYGARGGGLFGGTPGGFLGGAGLGALGVLAYRAYQERQAKQEGRGASAGATPAGSGVPSLGERLAGLLGVSGPAAPQAEAGELDDRRALLLVRAMVAAANADGELDDKERQQILGKLEEAGARPEDRAAVEREMSAPVALDTLLREVDIPETAEQFYLASGLAIRADSDAEKSYMRYLADRLKIDPKRVDELSRVFA